MKDQSSMAANWSAKSNAKPLSIETRKKISEALRSPEAREKKGKPSSMKGRSHSPETRAKMSESQRRRYQRQRGVNPGKTEHIIFDARASKGLG